MERVTFTGERSMRRVDITVYVNDEHDLFTTLQEVRSEIDRKVFNRTNIRQRNFSGTWEEEVTSSSPLADRLLGSYETRAKWQSNVATSREFYQFQKSEEL